MHKKIKNIFFIFIFLLSIVSVIKFYISEKNSSFIYKNRSLYSKKFLNDLKNLPTLENDTKNIIIYRDDIKIFKNKKKKYSFWDLISK